MLPHIRLQLEKFPARSTTDDVLNLLRIASHAGSVEDLSTCSELIFKRLGSDT